MAWQSSTTRIKPERQRPSDSYAPLAYGAGDTAPLLQAYARPIVIAGMGFRGAGRHGAAPLGRGKGWGLPAGQSPSALTVR